MVTVTGSDEEIMGEGRQASYQSGLEYFKLFILEVEPSL